MTRRLWLVLGVAGLVATAASPVVAAGPAQVDVEAYGGSSVGRWTCGPSARARYGGVGGNARFYLDDDAKRPVPPEETDNAGRLEPEPAPTETGETGETGAPGAERPSPELPPPPPPRLVVDEDVPNREPHGLSIGVGGGGESRTYRLLSCGNSPCDAGDVLPPTRVLGAGRGGAGYDWDYFGFRIGLLVFQRWEDNTDKRPTTNVLPDVEFRFGRRAGFHGGFGFGGYDVSTLFRPGAFLALGYATGPFATDLHAGPNLGFDDKVGVRGDLAVRYALSSWFSPGIAAAVTNVDRLSPEGRVFLELTP